MAFQFVSYHPLSGVFLGRLNFSTVSWSEVVNGSGALEGTITLPDDPDALAALAVAVEPDEAAIYVRDDASSSYVWGGVVTDQRWNDVDSTITITASDWRSWLYDVFLGPRDDFTGDNLYDWDQVDQLEIAREIVGYATLGGSTAGRPVILLGSETSGKPRDLHEKGLNFRYAGEVIDTMATRDGGFEWWISIVPGAGGGPVPRLSLAYPQRGGLVAGLLLRKTNAGANFKIVGDISRSSATRRTRVWTTGFAETLPFAADTDPAISGGLTLLREKQTSYDNVTDRTTLAEHARSERLFLHSKVNLLRVRVSLTDPPVGDYTAGDRGRLILMDRWYSMDLPAVRIVERSIVPLDEGGYVDLALDLNDTELVEVDPG